MFKLLVVSIFLASIFSGITHAASLRTEGGEFVGINDVSIADNYYHATFVDGLVDPANAEMYTEEFALAATFALLDLLNTQYAGSSFDRNPSMTLGCFNTTPTCFMATPFKKNAAGATQYWYTENYFNTPAVGNYFGSIWVDASNAGSNDGFTTRVIWSEVAEVPIPAAAWLLGSALLGLAGIKRGKAAS